MDRILRSSVGVDTLEIIDEYTVAGGLVSVRVTGDGRYLVDEPAFSEQAGDAYSRIIDRMRESTLLDTAGKPPPEAERLIYDKFWEVGLTMYDRRELDGMFHSLRYYIVRDLTGYGLLHPLMTDPDIEDILVSAPRRPAYIKHKRHSSRFHSLISNVSFPSDGAMVRFIGRMFIPTGNEPTVAKPGVVTYMPDKSRISATFKNVISEPGSTIAIRKFPRDPYVITHMMRQNTLTPRMAAYLWSLLDARCAGLVIGTTGSGKTTLLGAMATMMNPRWRILTIEDSLELQIPHQDWVRYHTKKTTSTVGAEHDVTIAKLIDQSLTQKPDYEIVGEIRDVADARQLFQSMGTGHGGLCLPPSEMLPVRCGAAVSHDTIRNVIGRFRDGEPLEAYSLAGGRCGWHRITGAVVKRGPDDWRRLVAGGAACTVHAGHRMITDRGVMPASGVGPGDSVPVVSGPARGAAARLKRGGGGAVRPDASGGRPPSKRVPGLRRFCLSGPGEFARERGTAAGRYWHVNDGCAWEAVETVERPSLGTALYDIEVRAAGNYAHGDGVITHNTTFHANTPQGALTRLELGGVSRAELALLAFIVYITEVRIGGVNKRRVRSVTEVTPGEGGGPVLRDIYAYRWEDDSFAEDDSALEAKQYVESCFRNNVRDPVRDMARREALLQECLNRDADDIASVFATLGGYYS